MKAPLLSLTAAGLAFLALAAAPLAHAGNQVFTAPISLSGENRCLECLVANVSRSPVKVKVTGHDENGVAAPPRLLRIEPGHATSTMPFCDDVGNYTCEFEMLHGNLEQIRAGSCEFYLTFGCSAAVVAR